MGIAMGCCLLLGASLAQPPQEDFRDSDWQFRYDLFQMLLEERGLVMNNSFVSAYENAEETVLVLIGDQSQTNGQVANALTIFVEAGGSALVMSDGQLVTDLGTVNSEKISTMNAVNYYEYADCIKLDPKELDASLTDVESVITNRPGWFSPGKTLEWKTLARFPAVMMKPRSMGGKPLISIGRSKKPGGGRAIVVADSSIVTNGMLWHGDNSILAIRLAEMLAQGSQKQLIFVSQGQFLPSYQSMPNPNMPPPAPEPTLAKGLRLANAVSRDVQESNLLNEALANQPRNMRPKTYYRILLAILAALVLLAIFGVILRKGTFLTAFIPHRKMQAAFQLRDHAFGQSADYRSAAGYLAREFCYELTGSKLSKDWQQFWAELKASRNPLTLSPAEVRELGEVIDVACRGTHRLNDREFHRLGLIIEKLRAKQVATLKTT